ncbi:MAG: CBS domain-containing protein [Anaerolineales bacterium]|nr:CBS domain-containing protein [Anaerolineales bacterium]
MKREVIKDWMTYDPIVIRPSTTLPEAHRLMKEYSIRRLPVVENDKLVGMVTLGDVRGAEPSGATALSIWEINYLISKLRVEEIMTPDPVVVSEEAMVGEAAHLMLKYKISGLPVVDAEGILVGIITESDIFRMVVHDWLKEAEPS